MQRQYLQPANKSIGTALEIRNQRGWKNRHFYISHRRNVNWKLMKMRICNFPCNASENFV